MEDKKQEIVEIVSSWLDTPQEKAEKILALFSVSLDKQSEATVCADCNGIQFVYHRKLMKDICLNCWEKQTGN